MSFSRISEVSSSVGSGKYDIVQKGRDGYKVCVGETGKCFSKKPLPLERAKAQQRALYAKDRKKQGKQFKELENQPTGTFSAIVSKGAMGEGSPEINKTGSKRDIANFIAPIVGEPSTSILNRITEKGMTTFGKPIKVVVTPAMQGRGLFDWLKKAGSSAVSAAKSGLSSFINNVSTGNNQPTTEIGDKFFKTQTKLFSPSGREDEPGIPPSQVIQNFVPNPLMPNTKTLYKMNKAAYDNSKDNIDGYAYVDGTPTLKIYNRNRAMIVAVRGTADSRDIITDVTIAAQDMQNMPRYRQDLEFLRQFQTRYPPGQYVYLLTGHSLGGAICDQLMQDGVGEQAITFNPAVQKNAYNSQNNKRIYQSEDPLYRMMGRYCRYNVEVRENRAKGALEQALSYAPVAGVGYTALKAHSLDNYVGGRLCCPSTSIQDRPILRTLSRPF